MNTLTSQGCVSTHTTDFDTQIYYSNFARSNVYLSFLKREGKLTYQVTAVEKLPIE